MEYLELCDMAGELMAEWGLCDCEFGYECCEGCPHVSESGCTISSFLCRLWVCAGMWERLSDTFFNRQRELLDYGLYKNWVIFRGEPWGVFRGMVPVRFRFGTIIIPGGGLIGWRGRV